MEVEVEGRGEGWRGEVEGEGEGWRGEVEGGVKEVGSEGRRSVVARFVT